MLKTVVLVVLLIHGLFETLRAQWHAYERAHTRDVRVYALVVTGPQELYAGGLDYTNDKPFIAKSTDGGRSFFPVWQGQFGEYPGVVGMAMGPSGNLLAVYRDNLLVFDTNADTLRAQHERVGFDAAPCDYRMIGDVEVVGNKRVFLTVCDGVLDSDTSLKNWSYQKVTRTRLGDSRLSFADSLYGLLLKCGFQGAFRTTDGGASWLSDSLGPPSGEFYDVVAMPGGQGVLVGSSAAYTVDRGRTWNGSEAPPLSGVLGCSSVVAVDDTLVWAAATSNILHSKDGGRTWDYQVYEMKEYVLAIAAYDAHVVHAGGTTIHLATTNGGDSGLTSVQEAGNVYRENESAGYPMPADRWFKVTVRGEVTHWRIVDGFGRDVPTTGDITASESAYILTVHTHSVASGVYYVVVTTDTGEMVVPLRVHR